MIRIEPRESPSRRLTIGIPVASALLALLLAAIPLSFAGANIGEAYQQMAKGIFGSLFAFTEMLTRATPLIFTGLAATLAFRAKLWNIGAEGQLYLGAMAAVAVGTGWLEGPPHIAHTRDSYRWCISWRSGHGRPCLPKNPLRCR